MKLFDELKSARFIAIARRVPADRIVKCARAVAEAGVTFLEITFDPSDPDTLSDTAAKLTAVRRELPDLHLGCGTVLSVEMADAAARAGAEFLVAPNTNKKVIDRAHEHGIRCNLFWSDDPEEAAGFLADGIDTVLSNHYWQVAQVVHPEICCR